MLSDEIASSYARKPSAVIALENGCGAEAAAAGAGAVEAGADPVAVCAGFSGLPDGVHAATAKQRLVVNANGTARRMVEPLSWTKQSASVRHAS
jgi:hypothetical protein